MKRVITFLVLFLFSVCVFSQDPNLRWGKDIQKFKQQDSAQMPPVNAILLIGSSSFTMWQDVQDYFKDYTIINRGFGGSTLADQLVFVNDIIVPYKPKQVLIYCGENDLASNDSITAKMVFNRFSMLFNMIRKRLPETYIGYVSMKPSPSRQHLLGKMQEGNTMIKAFLTKKEKTSFIDVYSAMIDKEGKPVSSLFRSDSLHMNKEGYAIWQKQIQPYLVK